MRVLWFSPVPPPAVCEHLNLRASYGGGWVGSLLRALSGNAELELAVAWAHRDFVTRKMFTKDGVHYYLVPDPGWLFRGDGLLRKASNRLEPFLGQLRDRRALKELLATVEDYRPNLIHVFGSELPYGLVAPLSSSSPTVVWIQGILDVCRTHFFGGISNIDRWRHPTLMLDYCRMKAEATRERRIYRDCKYFIGRTEWDAAHQSRLQPRGIYYKVDECIRPEFLEARPWQLASACELTVYTTTSAALLKGTDVLIRAIALLRNRFPNIRLRVGGLPRLGNAITKRLFRLVRDLRVSSQVEFLGELDAAQIVLELTKARVFVLPSFIENSPNSLAEAQLVGTPVVASCVGGVPDMVTDRETGLLFQAGDSAVLASRIAQLLTDDSLAVHLSTQGRQVAQVRHSPVRICHDLMATYRDIVGSRHNS